MGKEINPREMSVFKNNKAVVALINKLRQATPGKGSHIHREDEVDDNGRRLPNSLIGINLVNYDADPTIFVQDNLTPSQVNELYYEAQIKRRSYEFSGNGQKIFGDPDENGNSTVRALQIIRQEYIQRNGETVKMSVPWKISIQNGKGKKAQSKTGGTYCQKGTFILDKKAEIYLSDGDFFALMDKAVTYIRAWEQCVANNVVAKNEAKIREADAMLREMKS